MEGTAPAPAPSSGTCPICLTEFDGGGVAVFTVDCCGQRFCADCIPKLSRCPLCRGQLRLIRLSREHAEAKGTAPCMFIRLKKERQLFEIRLAADITVAGLYEELATMFYLSPKHIKIIHKGRLVDADTLKACQGSSTAGGDLKSAPLLQLIGRIEGARTWKDEERRGRPGPLESCCIS